VLFEFKKKFRYQIAYTDKKLIILLPPPTNFIGKSSKTVINAFVGERQS